MGERNPELSALIAEQDKDARWGHRVDMRGPSLDYTFAEGGTFGDIVGYEGPARETAIRKVPRPQKWTRQQIVGHIQKWVEEHGELPLHADWNKPNGRGIPSAASVARHSGSWDAGIRAAGFEPRGPGGCTRNPVTKTNLRPRVRPQQKRNARLSTERLSAAYVLYDRKRMSVPEIADLLWEKYGYPSPRACSVALNKCFHLEGFRLRTKSEARMCLSDEKRKEIARRMHEGRRRRRAAA